MTICSVVTCWRLNTHEKNFKWSSSKLYFFWLICFQNFQSLENCFQGSPMEPSLAEYTSRKNLKEWRLKKTSYTLDKYCKSNQGLNLRFKVITWMFPVFSRYMRGSDAFIEGSNISGKDQSRNFWQKFCVWIEMLRKISCNYPENLITWVYFYYPAPKCLEERWILHFYAKYWTQKFLVCKKYFRPGAFLAYRKNVRVQTQKKCVRNLLSDLVCEFSDLPDWNKNSSSEMRNCLPRTEKLFSFYQHC